MNLKLTRERIVLGGLLLAAGGGLLADQYLFAEAGDPAANEFALPKTATAAPKPAQSPVAPLTAEQSFGVRLRELAGAPPTSPDTLRNLFSRDAVAASTNPHPNAWGKRLLNGVLFGADGKGVAIVDGRMVPIGSRLDGMQLVRVTKVMAVFSDGTNEITLKISQKSGQPN